MKVSSKTDYALRTVLELSLSTDGSVTKASTIAGRQSIPLKFLEQILLALRSGGVVASRRGARGGYYLASPPRDITLAEVVRLTEDSLVAPAASRRTTDGEGFGLRADPFARVWREIEDSIEATLAGVTFEDMKRRVQHLRREAVQDYNI